MINEKNLNNIYKSIINNKELTTKELNSLGFNANDLTELVKEGIIKRVKRGYYSLISVDYLYNYGLELVTSKKYSEASLCFNKCYELNPNHLDTCLQLFLEAINLKNYEKAFSYFNSLYKSDNRFYINDCNFYLYLLSMIVDVPEQYREYVKCLNFRDIRVDFDDIRYEDVDIENKIRGYSLSKRFSVALKKLDELVKEQGKAPIQDSITITLLWQAIEKQNIFKQKINDLITNKRYDEIIIFLENVQKIQSLSRADTYVLLLAKQIKSFNETKTLPEVEIKSTDKLFDAIDGKNYELALEISKKYCQRKGIKTFDNGILMLLEDIVNLNKIKLGESIEKNDSTDMLKDEEKNINESKKNEVTFATVIQYLMQQDLNNTFRVLREYLSNINKIEFEFLVIDLIKISLIENDMAYVKPMMVLTSLSGDNFNFDITYYIQNFYESLAQSKFELARIYLDIIANSDKLEHVCVPVDCLEQILTTTENMVNHNDKKDMFDKTNSSLKVFEEKTMIENHTQVNNILTKQQTDENINVDGNSSIGKNNSNENSHEKVVLNFKQKDYNDIEMINGKLDELYKNGIVLLKPMDNERIEKIHDVVKNMKDVVSFSINTDNGRQVVLRYKPMVTEHIDISAVASEGNSCYSKYDFNKCIKLYRTLLELKEPRAWVYAKLGLAYMKKRVKNTAIDYLTIATALSYEEQSDYDFSDLLASLKGMIDDEDKKPKVKMTIEDFEDDIDNNYGITNIDDLLELIRSGMTIDNASKLLGLNEEQQSLAAIFIAREYYSLENYSMGDRYLKKAEKSKNKTKFVKHLLEEVRKNKKFYSTRLASERIKL